MHEAQDDAALVGEVFGQNVRAARARKGWSQRELAEALDERGLKLDPSAVTRIERGTREVKLREAVAMAECLKVELTELLIPVTHDPLSLAIELRRQAGACLSTGWTAFAQFGIHVQQLMELLGANPTTRNDLSKLSGLPEGLGASELVACVLTNVSHELQRWIEDSKVPVDERIAGELERTVLGAVDNLFTAKPAGEPLQPNRLPANRGDAEA